MLISSKFFLRTADSDVHRYLKLFTFEPLEVLETIMEEHNKAPPKRIAQHKLAQEVVALIHGESLASEVEREHKMMFNRSSVSGLQTNDDGNQPTDDAKKAVSFVGGNSAPTSSLILPKSLVYNQSVDRILYHAGLVASRSEGHRVVSQKGAYLGARPGGSGTMGEQVDWSPATHWDGKLTAKYIIDEDTLIIRVGKLRVRIIKIISDAEFEQRGLSAPGWKESTPEKPIAPDIMRMKRWNKKHYVAQAPIHREHPSMVSTAESGNGSSPRGGFKIHRHA